MKYKVGDKVKIRKGSLVGNIYTISHIESCGHIELSDLPYVFFDYELEPVDADGGKIAYAPNGAALFWKPEPEKPISIEEQLGLPKGVSIHDLPTSEWYNPVRLTFKNGSSIEALPQKDDDITTLKPRDESMGFESPYLDLSCFILPTNSREFEEKINKELAEHFNAFSNDGISAKNGGKNSMKFTFYVTEDYRIDKSNNTRIPTMTTEVLINGKDYQYGGSATCDKTDYEEREGVLNAIANAVCGGNFDREFNKVMKNKAFANKKSRTCTYCGKVLNTIEEKQEHEAWHVERRKARRERYLLRKRAKEIAFEEQAQKMAKEMIDVEKGAK